MYWDQTFTIILFMTNLHPSIYICQCICMLKSQGFIRTHYVTFSSLLVQDCCLSLWLLYVYENQGFTTKIYEEYWSKDNGFYRLYILQNLIFVQIIYRSSNTNDFFYYESLQKTKIWKSNCNLTPLLTNYKNGIPKFFPRITEFNGIQ